MTPTFAIGIPTLNRMDLLQPALLKYLQDFPGVQIFVLDNGNQQANVNDLQIIYIHPEKNLGVAASWNRLCSEIFLNHTHAVIVNDDIILGYGTKKIYEAIDKHPGRLITTILDWCVFIIPKTIFEKTGPFDEAFYPAYYEDSDYQRRLSLSGNGIARSELLSPSVYRNNSTAEKDSSVHVAAHKNKTRYIQKWGGPPGGEKFSIPFNGKPEN